MEQVMSKVKEYWGKAKEFFKKVPKKILILAIAAVVVAIGVFTYFQANQPYSVLFTGLNSDEASSIMQYLETQGASDYRFENNDTILVPKSQENSLKARLLMEGYPKSGFSYSTYYDHVGSLSTESERNTAYLLSLQDRMGAVIRCFDGVKDAVVTITPGSTNTYVLDNSSKGGTSAGVFVTMQSGQVLSEQQAQAIRTFVSHSVQGLTIDSVSISDNLGNLYSADFDNVSVTDASQLKIYLEEKYNNIIRTNVMRVLVPLFGEENVKVGVTCNVDVNKSTVDKKEVFLPEWSTNGEGIIGSKVYENYIVRGQGSGAGGVVGTTTNSDLDSDFDSYVEEGNGSGNNGQEIKQSGQVDYNNSQTDTHTERVAGYLSDCMVSVSINSSIAGSVDGQALSTHVARAAGITDEMAGGRISLYFSPFYVENLPQPGDGTNSFIESIKDYLLYIAIAAGVLLLLIILLIIISKKRRKKKAMLEEYAQSQESPFVPVPVPAPEGADVMTLQSEKSMELRKDIRKFADDNPEVAAQMLRAMLRGGENDG